ncbi:hypothetical protein GIB67_041601 [Kingdonia uniflora]|uniref:Uncharacterized protein n=1 Tax=Kingdonia uniflora TaxID=39325 RepID=A0A7J7MQQ9_9MAGN|nr:hypothetical protein GIB67_041601 [Kingdonia uniflora]
MSGENPQPFHRTFCNSFVCFSAGNKFADLHRRFQSSYVGYFTLRVRNPDASCDTAILNDLYRTNDPEGVMRLFESQTSLHSNPSAIVEYMKALVKVERLDESELLKTIQRGHFVVPREERSIGGLLAFQNVEKSIKDDIHGLGALIQDLGMMKVLNLKKEVQSSTESSTKFSDVKGVDEAKAELEEIVHFLRDPERFTHLGVKIPKGFLLVEPPGTGKTMLARIIAGEAGVPFVSCNSRVLKAEDVDLMIIARGARGFSGAALANLVNIAALKAAMDGAKAVTTSDLEDAKDKIEMGSERKSAVISNKLWKESAVHEAGHALVAIYTDGALAVHKATIVPRGAFHSMISYVLDKNEEISISKGQLLAQLDVSMGGWAAEDLIYGLDGVTSVACSNIQKAIDLAITMVTQYGISKEIGLSWHDYYDIDSMSTVTKLLIKKEVKELLDAAYNNAKDILTVHR